MLTSFPRNAYYPAISASLVQADGVWHGRADRVSRCSASQLHHDTLRAVRDRLRPAHQAFYFFHPYSFMAQTRAKSPAHTAGPWSVFENIRPSVFAQIGNENVELCEMSDLQPKNERLANAEFIVRACNAHEKLITAGKAMLRGIEKHQEELPANPVACELYAALHDAISEAEHGKAN